MDGEDMVCDCGNGTYNIKFNISPTEIWAECEECGRPTSVVGDGVEKKHEFMLSGEE